jgi:hypothetical protein
MCLLALGPALCRIIAFYGTISLMTVISAGGHYGNFNSLTAALAMSFLDDRQVASLPLGNSVLQMLLGSCSEYPSLSSNAGVPWQAFARMVTGICVLASSAVLVLGIARPLFRLHMSRRSTEQISPWLQAIHDVLLPLSVGNECGPMARMAAVRGEIVLFAVAQGEQWHADARLFLGWHLSFAVAILILVDRILFE